MGLEELKNKVEGAVKSATSSSGSHNTAAPGAGAPAGTTGGAHNQPGQDYGDKGLAAIERKFGQDPNKLGSANEKGTDAIRGAYEKHTGKHVPEKFSN